MKNILLIIISLLMLSSCNHKTWVRTESGVIVRLKDKTGHGTRFLMLEPVNDRIIHVIASPNTKPSSDKSLCVVASPAKEINYNISQLGDSLVLSLSLIHI